MERDFCTESDSLELLLQSRKPYTSAPRSFYTDEKLFALEMEKIFFRDWIFVAHTCDLKKPGDFLTFKLADDSFIVLRDDDGAVKGFANVCRHRGTQLCTEASGHLKNIVCPYHRWAYKKDGSLFRANGMPDDLDKSNLGLFKIAVAEVQGFIFASLCSEPASLDQFMQDMNTHFKPQGLAEAKVARFIDYTVKANWKLVWENNRECYHCIPNHPQYIKANYDHFNADDTPETVKEKMRIAVKDSEEKWSEKGFAITHKDTGIVPFPDVNNNVWYRINRTCLSEGFVTESMDGKLVAPFMGEYTEASVGTLRVRGMPNFWTHASCDHAVTTRILPLDANTTTIRVAWLVHERAEEGKDYSLEKLMPFWQLTSEQDWEICERAHQGVASKFYTPGPLSPHKEYNVNAFWEWHAAVLES